MLATQYVTGNFASSYDVYQSIYQYLYSTQSKEVK